MTQQAASSEARRLAALRRLALLDTGDEPRFDRLTEMVRRLLKVPMASVSLIDENRQWLKSAQGMAYRSSPRDISFCSHTILQDQTLVVPDARIDERFANNPLVTGTPHIVFYAGHPIRASDGSKIGTLCAIDTRSRELTAEQLHTLRDLAAMAEIEVRALSLSDIQEQLARDFG